MLELVIGRPLKRVVYEKVVFPHRNRKPLAEDRNIETKDRKPTTEDRNIETKDRKPTTKDQNTKAKYRNTKLSKHTTDPDQQPFSNFWYWRSSK